MSEDFEKSYSTIMVFPRPEWQVQKLVDVIFRSVVLIGGQFNFVTFFYYNKKNSIPRNWNF